MESNKRILVAQSSASSFLTIALLIVVRMPGLWQRTWWVARMNYFQFPQSGSFVARILNIISRHNKLDIFIGRQQCIRE